MKIKNNKIIKNNKKQKKNKSDSDDDISIIETNSKSDSDYETVSDSDNDSSSESVSDNGSRSDSDSNSDSDDDYTPSQNTDDDDDDSDYENELSDDTSEDEDDDNKNDHSNNKNKKREEKNEKIKKTISNIFPSKYMKKKMEEMEEKEEKRKNKNIKKKENNKNNENEKKSKKKEKKDKTMKRKSKSNLDDNSEDDNDNNNDDTDGEYDKEKKINIIFGFNDDGLYEDEEDDEIKFIEYENDECDSDEEKVFMKETYTECAIPNKQIKLKNNEVSENSDNSEKKIQRKINKKSNKYENKKSDKIIKKNDEIEDEPEREHEIFQSEYNDLCEMKKFLIEKLNEKPNSKSLIKSLNKCDSSIKKLIKKKREKNTKEYYKLITKNNKKITNEIDYFRKKLSNKEQLNIVKDLKEINKTINIEKPYRLSLLETGIPNKYKTTVFQKLNLLKSMEPGDPEYFKIKNWIDTFMRIPFGKYKDLKVNLTDGLDVCDEFMNNSIKKLNECVYGLNDAKIQIMQIIGQWIVNPSAIGTAIAIKGPMGTGKTTLVKEGISKILGREFAFITLGGAGDSSFLEGHSYTYEGSTWGKIIQILIDSKCMNPVIYFDELDKISDSARGEEIIGILTHLTDTTQNNQFHDKYFSEIDFDLSKCLFIFSYNDETRVNPILRDRMYCIQTKGYEAKDKITIANNYLLPKIREQVKLDETQVIIPNETIDYIINNRSFTKNEDGVRNLKRCLEIIFTKLNLFRLIKNENNIFIKEIGLNVEFPFTVNKKDVDILIKNEETLNQSLLSMYV